MRFANEQFILYAWLLLPLLAIALVAWRRQRVVLQQLAKPENQPVILPNYRPNRQRLLLISSLLVAILLFLALLRPQWGFRWIIQQSRGSDLMFVVDTSDSMRATDLQPNRLERARRKIIDMLRLLRGERIGLVAFAGESHLLCPLTLDYSAFTIFLDYLDTQLIPTQGTDLGGGIADAVRGFDKQSRAQRNILLITDGEDHEESIDKAIELAKAAQAKIFIVGIGSSEGAPIPAEQGGGFRKDDAGNVILTRLNESLLQKLASATGGTYVRSMAGDLDLETIYKTGIRIGQNDSAGQQQEDRKQEYTERYQFFLLPAILLLLLPYLFGSGRKKVTTTFVLLFLPTLFSATTAVAGPLSRGVKSYNQEKFDEAQQQFLQGQVENPDNPAVHYNLGNSLYRLKRYDEAAKEFDKALNGNWQKIDKNERDLQFNFGNALFQQQRYDEAIKRYESALKFDPQDEDAQHNLALAKKMLELQKQQQQEQNEQQKQQNEQKNQNSQDEQSTKSQPGDNQQQPQNAAGKEQKTAETSADKAAAEELSKEEAKMWLSGIEENGKENLQQTLKRLHGKKRTPVKDW